ncbi:MAG: hypothetical protein A4E62_02655 [Syntrophorhabdus sp. PtaU1.Bin002]|nr:MAG: hypothetical protein A4E62_02655 [Syntrophorhabdus sp. PtaU1.Bin002]
MPGKHLEGNQLADSELIVDDEPYAQIENRYGHDPLKRTGEGPGLDKYSAVLKFEGIEENFSYAPPDAQEVTIKLLVLEDNKEIPVEYRASGHHCFLGVSRNGKSLVISKNPCKSLVLDKNVRGTQYEAEPLVLALQ